ncbi:hypothetical protein A4S06_04945 [Erysipelotrichaceae bacterium MTC7]|nr:hypothetical protein A4S06_04945 [Erysipelotrichaceae bacterium MTC7]
MEYLLPEVLNEWSNYRNESFINATNNEESFKQIQKNNQNSIATRFLLEYVAASKIQGSKHVQKTDMEHLLSICILIIEWAQRSDQFKYNLVKSNLTMLKSNRIGVKESDFYEINRAMHNSQKFYLNFDDKTQPNFNMFSEEVNRKSNELLVDAFTEMFGFSNVEFNSTISLICNIFYGHFNTIIVGDKEELINTLESSPDAELSSVVIRKVIDVLLSLERNDFLEPPKGNSKFDVLPWRFNRDLSFIRKPIVEYDNKLYFGVRNIMYAKTYLYNLIFRGKLKTKNKKMKVFMSEIRNQIGKDFNMSVAEMIRQNPLLEVFTEVKKIGKKKITNDNGDDLGDIDILVINKSKKKIFVIETKEFSDSRNPYDIAMEIKSIYGEGKSFQSKHFNRTKWIIDHKKEIIDFYSLKKGSWKIEPLFIFSEYLISKHLIKNSKIKCISLGEITKKSFT